MAKPKVVARITRSRLVVPGVGSLKGDFESAQRMARELPGSWVELSEATLYTDGSERLEPWRMHVTS